MYFPSAGRGKYWFGDTLLPYPRRKPSSFTLGFGRRNFKKTESPVVLMWTLRSGLLPKDGNKKMGDYYFTSLAFQGKFEQRLVARDVVIGKHAIYVATLYPNTPTCRATLQEILKSKTDLQHIK